MPMIKVLGMDADETSFPVRSFTDKVVLFWLGELVICKLDQERVICAVVGKGFFPRLLSFAVMDVLIIPRIVRRLRR